MGGIISKDPVHIIQQFLKFGKGEAVRLYNEHKGEDKMRPFIFSDRTAPERMGEIRQIIQSYPFLSRLTFLEYLEEALQIEGGVFRIQVFESDEYLRDAHIERWPAQWTPSKEMLREADALYWQVWDYRMAVLCAIGLFLRPIEPALSLISQAIPRDRFTRDFHPVLTKFSEYQFSSFDDIIRTVRALPSLRQAEILVALNQSLEIAVPYLSKAAYLLPKSTMSSEFTLTVPNIEPIELAALRQYQEELQERGFAHVFQDPLTPENRSTLHHVEEVEIQSNGHRVLEDLFGGPVWSPTDPLYPVQRLLGALEVRDDKLVWPTHEGNSDREKVRQTDLALLLYHLHNKGWLQVPNGQWAKYGSENFIWENGSPVINQKLHTYKQQANGRVPDWPGRSRITDMIDRFYDPDSQ